MNYLKYLVELTDDFKFYTRRSYFQMDKQKN